MANWCENQVKLKAPSIEDREKIEELCVDKKPIFSAFVPEPDVAYDSETGKGNKDYNWYDWRMRNWGCKWDVDEVETIRDDEDSSVLYLRFNTAWEPPLKFFDKLSEQGWTGEIAYSEPSNEIEGYQEF